LPDAEAAEDPPQQVLARELAGDFTQRLLGFAQLFGDQLARAPFREQSGSFIYMTACARERIQMALARADRTGFQRAEAHAGLEMLAQGIAPFTGERGNTDL